MKKEKILVVDDEEHIVELLKFNLVNQGYDVFCAYDGLKALEVTNLEKPNLILLDVMLPQLDGLEVCKEIRKNDATSSIPIIMLTAKSEELDTILGLELGADDYITKPFSIRELLARVKAVIRRSKELNQTEKKSKYCIKNLEIDFDRHEVYASNKKVDLTLKEFELLHVLVKNSGKILTRDVLLDKIWGYEFVGESRTVDVHIRYLRKKIEDDDKNPKFIETIRGVGYRFNPQHK